MRALAKATASIIVGAALAFIPASDLRAEGSRSLHPATYPATGSRSNLDLQPGQHYMNRVIRRGFNYVYAEAGEYILVGSSNIGAGDISIYNPQSFGIPGDETLPGTVDFSCLTGTIELGDHYFGGGLGDINSRAEELAGPNSANNTATVVNGWGPCVYQAPQTGIYGVQFGTGSGGGPNGNVNSTPSSSNTAAAWDITVRADNTSLVDLNGRVFTYAFLGFTGGNNRPVFSSLYYVTLDGYRYQQDLRGLDPNGYALYANTFGFLDDGEPLYKTLRSNNFNVSNLPLGVSAQAAEFPIFFSDISPGAPAESEAEQVLTALGIPLAPPSPQISNVAFAGAVGSNTTATGVGGEFSFDTTDTVSYEIVISRDGIDFDAANPLNKVLTGIAFSGVHSVQWNGLDNDNNPFPASATPYDYRAFGRNGEVHFPIIDAENNGVPASAVPGGGPTITRLNGAIPGDTTVFFDDRGYVTRSGELIGILNGFLCGAASPGAASPPVSLAGVDSSTIYRQWENGGNSNSDCNASAGWGDAKGVNLWTYFLTPEFSEQLIIIETLVDVATDVTTVDTAEAGASVQGTFSFGNNGASTANGVTYGMTMSPGLGAVSFGNLPVGASASYDNGSGVVTLSGFPGTLTAGEVYSGMTFSYTAPLAGPVDVDTTISTTDTDEVPANNADAASTAIGSVDLSTQITGIPATADANSTVTGSVVFSNLGTDDADGVAYALSIGGPGNTVTDVMFSGLPPGASAVYNVDGTVTFTGMPSVLPQGNVLSISFSYTSPPDHLSTTPIDASISTTSGDADPTNDADSASTTFLLPDLSTQITGLPATGTSNTTVGGSVVYSNVSGTNDAQGVTYTLSIGGPGNTVTDVMFPVLPPGATAVYNGDGSVTFTNMPVVLDPGDTATVGFTYTSPMADMSTVPVDAGIATTSGDLDPLNDTDSASTLFTLPDLTTQITGLPTTAEPNSTVTGNVVFSNLSAMDTATGVTYTLSIGGPGNTVTDVMFPVLPLGGTAVYNGDGTVTFTGMPATLLPGEMVTVSFSYTTPMDDSSSIPVDAGVAAGGGDSNTGNNAASGGTTVSFASSAAITLVLESVCINDAPYLNYEIIPTGFTPTSNATIELVGSDLSVASVMANQALTGTILWPEAAVNGAGRGIAWPGWDFIDDEWVEVPTTVRPELTVRAFVNPSTEQTVTYPPPQPGCNTNPPGFGYVVMPVPVLPWPLLLLTVLLTGGLGLRTQGVIRRRR